MTNANDTGSGFVVIPTVPEKLPPSPVSRGVRGARTRGPGPVQRAVLDALHSPETIVVLATTELADRILGRVDREAIRQVRRAVDALAARGLVETWTASDPDALHRTNPEPLHARHYFRRTRVWGRECRGEGCRFCQAGIPTTRFEGRNYHMATEVVAAKSRMRWVEYAWTARPVAERLGFVELWIDDTRERLDVGLARVDLPGVEGVLARHGVQRERERLAKLEDDRRALLAAPDDDR
jgi:hypothetical protein